MICVLAVTNYMFIVLQTDQGADRFFRFQTASGQYRKEVCNIHVNNVGDYLSWQCVCHLFEGDVDFNSNKW